MQRAHGAAAERARGLAQHCAQLLGRADVVAGGEQVAGVEAHAEPLARAGRVDQLGELVERAPERAAGSCRVLEVQLAAFAVGERRGDRLAGARDRLADVPGLRRARVQDHGARADRVPDAQRVRQRRQRFGADLLVVGGAVEQVDGVDQDGFDRAVGHRLAERRDVFVAIDRRFPLPRRLVEDLDRLTAALHTALDCLRQAAGGRDVRADQHARDYRGCASSGHPWQAKALSCAGGDRLRQPEQPAGERGTSRNSRRNQLAVSVSISVPVENEPELGNATIETATPLVDPTSITPD